MINVGCREKTINLKEYYAKDGDQEYRYLLTRFWDESDKVVSIIMCNPSDASYIYEDKSAMNLNNYFVNLGYNKINIVNLFSFRNKEIVSLNNRNSIYENETNYYINRAFEEADLIVVGWGYGKEHKDKPKYMKDRIIEIKTLLRSYKHKDIKCMDEGRGNIHPLQWENKYHIELINYIF